MTLPSAATRLRGGLLATASILIALSVEVATAQSRGQAVADAALQRQADTLQQCLEKQLESMQVETTVAANGQITESVRVTSWGAATGGVALAEGALARCISTGTSSAPTSLHSSFVKARCAPAPDLQRLAVVEFAVGEMHPAWSANDRARVETLIPVTLTALAGGVRVVTATSPAAIEANELLRVRLEYRGSNISQRDLDDWVRMPRELHLGLELVDKRNGARPIAARELTAKVRAGLRGRYSANTGDAWFRELRQQLTTAAHAVLEPLACRAPWFEVVSERGKLQLSLTGFTGLKAGRSMLLVPSAEAAIASRWPIARIRKLPRADSAELEILRGNAEVCAVGCRAVLL